VRTQLVCCVVATIAVITLREHCEAVHADNDLVHMICCTTEHEHVYEHWCCTMLYNVRQCLASSGAPDLSDMMYVNVGNLLHVYCCSNARCNAIFDSNQACLHRHVLNMHAVPA